MTKKNYYELLGIKQDATEEEIGKAYLEYKNKEELFGGKGGKLWKKGIIIDKEKEKKEKEVVTMVAVLTDPEERERYNEHLEKFGHDEQFKPIFNVLTDDWSNVIEKIDEWYEDKIEEVEFRVWKSYGRNIRKFDKLLKKNTKEWKCQMCYQEYKNLIILSEENPEPKLCLVCFIYWQGQKAGEEEKKIDLNTIRLIKSVEKAWKYAFPSTLILCIELFEEIKKKDK